jgi:lysophospholipase L1-like esterase
MLHNMNTTANLKRVVIYGDSNAWGYMPITGIRYPISERWTTIVQTMLGDKFDVIEQGLPGRTAGNIDTSKPFKNGLEHFLSSILPQYPFDILVIALGTNDLQSLFGRTPEQILADLAEYNELVKENKINCKIIFITPYTFYLPVIFDQAKEKVQELAKLFTVTDFDYLDMSKFEPKGTDRVHFTKEDHAMYAKLVYEKINSLK